MSPGPLDVRIALHAGPLLAQANRAGVLSAADVQVARRLGRLVGEDDERVLLAVALAVRGVRAGSVCVRLDDPDLLTTLEPQETDDPAPPRVPRPEPEPWQAAVEASALVAVGPGDDAVAPLRWVDGRLYLDRYWRHEQTVRAGIDGRLAAGPLDVDGLRVAAAVHRLFPSPPDGGQRLAAATAALSLVTVLTGGPGTGKTTTVARLLAVLHAVAGAVPADPVEGPVRGLRIALTAPTGRAAARLQEAVRQEVARFEDPDRRRVGEPVATTLHRLLGWRPGSSTRFRHDRRDPLPHDVVVVDETSMVSLPLMARLLEALRPQARLILVGDHDQLASVEAGAVLGDLVSRAPVADALPKALRAVLPDDVPADDVPADDVRPDDVRPDDHRDGVQADGVQPDDPAAALRNGVVRLRVVHRHGRQIGALAEAIRRGRCEDVVDLLRAGAGGLDGGVQFVETRGERPTRDELAGVRSESSAAGLALAASAGAGDAAAALRALNTHRLLLAHRRGPFGVAVWAAQVADWVIAAEQHGPAGAGSGGPAVAGGWYPGRPLIVTANDRDTGLYNGDTGVVIADGDGVIAVFGDPDHPTPVRVHRLPATETAYATTVHRGQGSQFTAVSLILPQATSPLLTRELLYTAVTRARHRVHLVGTAGAVRAAVGRPARRASGLRHPLV